MQSQIKDAKMNPVSAKKSPTLWGMKFFSSSSIFFQDHNFPLFVASSQESQMSSME